MARAPRRGGGIAFWFLILLGSFYLFNGISKLFSRNIYEEEGWWIFLGLAALLYLGAFFLRSRANAKAQQAEEQAAARRAEEEARRAEAQREAEERRQRQAEWEETHGRIETRLAGVTFTNEDGSSRQRALERIEKEGCRGDLTFKEGEFEGAPSISVAYEGTVLGHIPQDRVEEVAAVLDRIDAVSLVVEHFTPRDKHRRIYRADLTIVYNK